MTRPKLKALNFTTLRPVAKLCSVFLQLRWIVSSNFIQLCEYSANFTCFLLRRFPLRLFSNLCTWTFFQAFFFSLLWPYSQECLCHRRPQRGFLMLMHRRNRWEKVALRRDSVMESKFNSNVLQENCVWCWWELCILKQRRGNDPVTKLLQNLSFLIAPLSENQTAQIMSHIASSGRGCL